MAKLKLKTPKKPRIFALHMMLMNKSKAGGAHTLKVEKRSANKKIKELKEIG